MLVLSRKVGERLVIGEDIYIEVVEVRGNRARLGITAPDYCTIIREELLTPEILEEIRKDTRDRLQHCG